MVQKIFRCDLCKRYYRIGKSKLVDIKSISGSLALRLVDRVMICHKCWDSIDKGEGLVADKYTGYTYDILSDYVEEDYDFTDW